MTHKAGKQRIVLHLGFHKTGTTSLQRFMTDHRAQLAPLVDIVDPVMCSDAALCVWRYAMRPLPWRRRAMLRAVDALAGGLAPGAARAMFLTAENLSGPLPGTPVGHGVTLRDYVAIGQLVATQLVSAVRARFPGTPVILAYTTRGSEGWLPSAYAQTLLSSRLRLDFQDYKAALGPDFDLATQAQAIAALARPDDLAILPLEKHASNPLGLATPVFRLLGLPVEIDAGLAPPARLNTRLPSSVQDALLAANRRWMPLSRYRSRLKKSLVCGQTDTPVAPDD
jgi:hypothetical protein